MKAAGRRLGGLLVFDRRHGAYNRQMSISRRSLLWSVPAAWTGLSQSLAAASATGEDFWKMVAQQFPLEPGLLYFNAANVCPTSRPVMDRHLEFLRDFHANPSFQNRAKYVALEERVREKAAALLRASKDEIALTRNTSEGTNIIVKGLDLKAGDEILVTAHNHASNLESWRVRAKRDGIAVKALPVPVPAKSADELLSGIEAGITPRTRAIAVTHLTSTCGLRYPARQIGEIARRRGVWFHLDGAQSFGAMDIDLAGIGCDSFATSMHKWPMGPLECGLLYLKAARHAEVWPSIVTAGWSDRLVGARKFEVFGQRDDPRLVAVEAALDFLSLIGMERIEARVTELTARLKKDFAAMPALELKTNQEPQLSHGVVKVNVRRGDLKATYDRLWEKHRLALSLTANGDAAGLRFSPHIYNTMADVEGAIAAVRAVVG